MDRERKIDESGEIVATEKTFDGVLKIYNTSVDNNDIDLLSFMRGKQNQIQNAIWFNTQLQPQKSSFLCNNRTYKTSGRRICENFGWS